MNYNEVIYFKVEKNARFWLIPSNVYKNKTYTRFLQSWPWNEQEKDIHGTNKIGKYIY